MLGLSPMIEFNFHDYGKIDEKSYEKEKKLLLIELAKLQKWIISNNKKIAVVFEGRDTAGKTGSISTISKYLIPKFYRLVALDYPKPSESKNWFKRYEKHLPKNGEIVFFDRSWYSRALVEATMNYCTKRQYANFMRKVVGWERDFIQSGTHIVKFYLSIDKTTQATRTHERANSPLVYWKISDNDFKMLDAWDVFTFYKQQMFDKTSHNLAPWVVIKSNNKKIASLNALRYLLMQFEYDGKNLSHPKEWAVSMNNYEIIVQDEIFKDLTFQQYKILKKLSKNDH